MFLVSKPLSKSEQSQSWGDAINRAEQRGHFAVAQELREWAYQESLSLKTRVKVTEEPGCDVRF